MKQFTKKYLVENITQNYTKKHTKERVKSTNKATKKFAEKLKIADKIECIDESEAYITIKDHKEKFPEKAGFRLSNPSKSDIRKVSKHTLDQINHKVSQNTNVNQWKNSISVTDWCKAINNNLQYTFFVFDIESSPPISLDLYEKSLNFAKQITPIADRDLRIKIHYRKILLFHDSESFITWRCNKQLTG